jgi:hypothetical protein
VARELQNRVLVLVEEVLGQPLQRETCPDWLVRPGKDECGSYWPIVQFIYNELTGGALPEVMRKVESRKLDAVVVGPNDMSRVFEVDESKHFNPFRAATFRHYPSDTHSVRSRGVALPVGRSDETARRRVCQGNASAVPRARRPASPAGIPRRPR